MKRLFILMLTALLLCSFVGCDLFGDKSQDNRFEKIVREFESSNEKTPYYYSKLSSTEKAAYASIVAAINDSDTSAPVPEIDTDSLQAVTRAVSYDNPHFLWLSKKWTVTHYTTGASVEIPYLKTPDERKEMDDTLERKTEQILRGINATMGDYEKELYIHDYLVNNCQYDNLAVSDEEFNNAYTAYGALVEGKAVCEGYARAMQLLLAKVGVDSYLLTGTALDSFGATVNHMWNVVKIDSEWYHLDSTWDDPTSVSGFNSVWHSYFNLSDEEIRRDHFYDDETICTSASANYYRKKSLLLNSFNASELADVLADEIYKAKRSSTNFVELRFLNQSDFTVAKQAFAGRNLINTAISRINNKYGTIISTSSIYYSTIDTQFVIGIKF